MPSDTSDDPCELYNLCCDDKEDKEQTFLSIQQWLNNNKEKEQYFKLAATYNKGDHGRTPLHVLLYRGNPPLCIVETLIEYAPEVLKIENKCGGLPIHRGCCNGSSLDIIRAMVNGYPESVTMAAYAGSFTQNSTKNGFLPLHLACYNKVSLEILNFLIKCYPKGIEQKDKKGKTPLFILKETKYAMQKDASGKLPLHHACKNNYSADLISLLIQAYPKSINVKDRRGRKPGYYYPSANCTKDIMELLQGGNHQVNDISGPLKKNYEEIQELNNSENGLTSQQNLKSFDSVNPILESLQFPKPLLTNKTIADNSSSLASNQVLDSDNSDCSPVVHRKHLSTKRTSVVPTTASGTVSTNKKSSLSKKRVLHQKQPYSKEKPNQDEVDPPVALPKASSTSAHAEMKRELEISSLKSSLLMRQKCEYLKMKQELRNSGLSEAEIEREFTFSAGVFFSGEEKRH